MKKLTTPQMLTLGGSIVMVLALLLMPLIELKSYEKTIAYILRRGTSLVHNPTERAIGLILLIVMFLTPVYMAVRTAMGKKVQCWITLLPVICSLLLAVILLISSKPVSPALGLWLYLIVALSVMTLHFRNQK